MASRKATDIPQPFSYRITLSCGHVQLKIPPIPQLGESVDCGQCRVSSIVVVRDTRERSVICPDCRGVISSHHMLAVLSSATAADVHNYRTRKGHHATVIITGEIESV